MKGTDALKGFWRDEDGIETVEYALLAALVVAAAIAAWTLLGTNVSTMANQIATTIK
ncbi:Flp family type IVb pilin [uncultured Thiodictyon sp.]|jgi:pilus assembly protein Flp/PilA|uniref:Flp family type IVb pilin n=1 Tax=uncultured Thiodictyon sp. TaxID=1846217 RepID=UPI0025D14D20|nr:Flp family type IVb pilin [uncultured Thiodictyon sp.]